MKSSSILHKILILLLLAVMVMALVKCIDFPMPLLPPDDQSTELISDGKLLYTIVRSDASSEVVKQAAQHIKSAAFDQGISASLSNFGTKDINAYEILIGKTKYFPEDAIKDIDVSKLGIEGYVIKRYGAKIIIMGQNDKALLSATQYFTDNFLNVADKKTSMPENYLRVNSSGKYNPGVKLDGSYIYEYALSADASLENSLSDLSKMIEEKTGYKLTSTGARKIILTCEGADNNIVSAKFENGNLVIRARTPEQMKKAVVCFWYENLAHKTGNIDLPADLDYSRDLSQTVFYSDFDVTQSKDVCCLLEMQEAHNYANANGYKVFADFGAEYYISTTRKTVTIKTDVEWGNARITIDDSKVAANDGAYHIFNVASDLSTYSLSKNTITSLSRDMTNIGISLPQKSMISFTDVNTKHYIRYGENANSGSSKRDTIIVDVDGSIDMDAPLMWDFDTITSIYVRPIDEEVLTISGGIFTTIANQAPRDYNYYARGINIRRSNTVVDALEHYVTGEGAEGDPYSGFLIISDSAYVTVQNTILTGRKKYVSASGGVNMGTYDFSLGRSVSIKFINCSQSNDILDESYWGIMASNDSKNIIYDKCVFSRYDAHKGVTNGMIKDSIIGHAGVTIIGYGTFVIEDSIIHSSKAITLRADYGATWEGDIIIKNSSIIPQNPEAVYIVYGSTNPYHDFGYKCFMPTNVTIDGLTVNNATHLYVFSNYVTAYTSSEYEPPCGITESVSIKNSNIKPVLSPNAYLNSDIEYIYE